MARSTLSAACFASSVRPSDSQSLEWQAAGDKISGM